MASVSRNPPKYLAPGDEVSNESECITYLSSISLNFEFVHTRDVKMINFSRWDTIFISYSFLKVIATVERIGSLSSSVMQTAQPLLSLVYEVPGMERAFNVFGGNQYDIYAEMQRRYGNTMLLSKDIMGTDIVTIFHPEDIERGLRREGPLPRGLGQALLPFMKFYSEHAPNGLNLGKLSYFSKEVLKIDPDFSVHISLVYSFLKL